MSRTRESLAVLVLATTLSAPASAVVLEVGRASAEPGAAAEIIVDIDSTDLPLGALVFSVGFDRQKLRFDGTAKSGDQLSNVSVEAPQGYLASSTVLPHNGSDSIAVSIVRSGVATPLRSGQVRLKFETWPDAEGIAWVGILAGASAASTLGQLAPIETIDGSVAISAPSGELVVSPSSVPFDSAPSSAAVRLLNRGRGPLTVTSIDLQGSGFTIDPVSLPLKILPGADTVLTVHVRDASATRGMISITAAGGPTDRSQVNLELRGDSEERTHALHEWFLPGGVEAASIVVHDPQQTSSVAVGSAGAALPARIDLPRHETRRVADAVQPWYLIGSEFSSVRAALVDAAGRHVVDAVRIDALPVGTASISAADLRDASLTAVNLEASPVSIEVEIRSIDGRLLEERIVVLQPHTHQSIEISRGEDDAAAMIILHHSRADSSIAVWLTERSPSGTLLRLAR